MRDLVEAARELNDALEEFSAGLVKSHSLLITERLAIASENVTILIAAHDAAATASATLEEICEGVAELRQENERLRKALVAAQSEQRDVLSALTASLVAAISLIERGGKNAAPSDKMFAQMICDYKNAAEAGRKALAAAIEGQTP